MMGKVESFKMHDLFHDLAQLVAKYVCCNINDNDVTTLSEQIHHVSSKKAYLVQLHRVKSLRTYIL